MAGEYKLSSVHVHSKLCDGKNTLDELAAQNAGLYRPQPHPLRY